VGKAIKEMRDKKATEDVEVQWDLRTLFGEDVLKTNDTTGLQHIRNWRGAKDFVEATMIALKKKSEAKKIQRQSPTHTAKNSYEGT
jgi:hypothetical protein